MPRIGERTICVPLPNIKVTDPTKPESNKRRGNGTLQGGKIGAVWGAFRRRSRMPDEEIGFSMSDRLVTQSQNYGFADVLLVGGRGSIAAFGSTVSGDPGIGHARAAAIYNTNNKSGGK